MLILNNLPLKGEAASRFSRRVNEVQVDKSVTEINEYSPAWYYSLLTTHYSLLTTTYYLLLRFLRKALVFISAHSWLKKYEKIRVYTWRQCQEFRLICRDARRGRPKCRRIWQMRVCREWRLRRTHAPCVPTGQVDSRMINELCPGWYYYLLLTTHYLYLPYRFAVPRKTSIFANWIHIII